MSTWVLLIGGLALFVLLQAVYWNIVARGRSRHARLATRLSLPTDETSPMIALRDARLAKHEGLQALLADWPFTQSLADLLNQAGIKLTVAELLARMLGGAVAVFGAGWLLGMEPVLAFLLALVTAFVPVVWASGRRARRVEQIETQLPQALEVMSLFLRAGRSLPQAIEGMGENLPGLIREEFRLCYDEYRLGRPIDETLRNFADRYPSVTGLRLFASGAAVLGQTGGNLLEIIERIRKTIEGDRQYSMKLKALTGETRGSARMLAILPGAFGLISLLLNPGYFGLLLNEPLGNVVLGIALVLWLLGVVWIRVLMRAQPL